MNNKTLKLALLLLPGLFLSCSLIVKSKIKDNEVDGGSDTTADPELEAEEEISTEVEDIIEPDFDPDSCGVWGTVSIPNPEEVDLNSGNPSMDGDGVMLFAVYYPDMWYTIPYVNGKVYPNFPTPFPFGIDEVNYYCIPREFFSIDDIQDAWIIPLMYDRSYVEQIGTNDFLDFQMLVPDPLTLMIIATTYKPDSETERNKSPLYWVVHYPDTELNIDLIRRVSRITGTVQFTDFSITPATQRSGRLCVTVLGEREPGSYLYSEYKSEILGSNYYDLEDEQVEDGVTEDPPAFSFSVNFAAGKNQRFMVHLKYAEGIEYRSSFSACGGSSVDGSCDSHCYMMGGAVGIDYGGAGAFTIDTIEVSDPGECDINMDDICP